MPVVSGVPVVPVAGPVEVSFNINHHSYGVQPEAYVKLREEATAAEHK